MSSQTNTSQPVRKKAKAKGYKTPQLVEYGSIQQLTLAIGNMGTKDGGSVVMQKKTSP